MYHLSLALVLLSAPHPLAPRAPDARSATAPRPLARPAAAAGHDGAWLWRLSPRALAAPQRLEEGQLRPGAGRRAPPADDSLLVAQPVPSVVTLERMSGSDALGEDSCLGWHAQSVANFQRLQLGWLTVDQAAVAALQPGHCNGAMGLDLLRLGARHP